MPNDGLDQDCSPQRFHFFIRALCHLPSPPTPYHHKFLTTTDLKLSLFRSMDIAIHISLVHPTPAQIAIYKCPLTCSSRLPCLSFHQVLSPHLLQTFKGQLRNDYRNKRRLDTLQLSHVFPCSRTVFSQLGQFAHWCFDGSRGPDIFAVKLFLFFCFAELGCLCLILRDSV